MSLQIVLVEGDAELKQSFDIRITVFVDEQKVPMEEEIDEYEDVSRHFLAYYNGQPCGAFRWRFTEEGTKLERFAVLKEFRGKGVGVAMVAKCIEDIEADNAYQQQPMYLNAQIDAMALYEKFGFKPVGDMFLECDIEHMKMVKY